MPVGTTNLNLTRRVHGDHVVVTAVGAITRHTVIQLRTVLLQTLARHNPHLILDVSAVEDVDDVGVDALRRTGDRAKLLGGRLRLAGPTRAMTRQLRDTGAAWSVSTHATVRAALDAAAADDAVAAVPDWLDQVQPAALGADEDNGTELPTVGVTLDADAAGQHEPVPVDGEDGHPHTTS